MVVREPFGRFEGGVAGLGVSHGEFHVSFVQVVEDAVFAVGLFAFLVEYLVGLLQFPVVNGCLEGDVALIPRGAPGKGGHARQQ